MTRRAHYKGAKELNQTRQILFVKPKTRIQAAASEYLITVD